ncbi:hypothetical protein JXA12_00065 [Candidatus Woesearchaeota archaeon]|nr:hypothetical protein [Candidatus Woesearchaeota archaeon]
MRTFIIGLLVAAALLLLACAQEESINSFEECVAAGYPIMESYPRQCSTGQQTFAETITGNDTDQEPIGGERDEHNCLVAAGYSYDEEVGACTRSWELDEEQRAAARIAVQSLSSEGWTVTEVLLADNCDACYTVELDRNGARNTLSLADGKVIDASGGDWACTMEYQPVCGFAQVQCVTEPCLPVQQTFSNRCVAEAAGAFNITDGACEDAVNPEGACWSFDGTWLPEYQECEGMSEEQCENLGGTYDGCASACRHDPDAEICIEVCVPVCAFS